MKNVLFYCIVFSLSLTSCITVFENKIKGNGRVTIEERTVSSITNSGVGSIYYSGDTDIKLIESSGVGKIHKNGAK